MGNTSSFTDVLDEFRSKYGNDDNEDIKDKLKKYDQQAADEIKFKREHTIKIAKNILSDETMKIIEANLNEEDDPDFDLAYAPVSPQLIRHMQANPISLRTFFALSWIHMNASNHREGISKKVVIKDLSSFLMCHRTTAERAIGTLIAKAFIDKTKRKGVYSLPFLVTHRNNVKNMNARKHIKKAEKKILIVEEVFPMPPVGLTDALRKNFISKFVQAETIDDEIHIIEILLKHKCTKEEYAKYKELRDLI